MLIRSQRHDVMYGEDKGNVGTVQGRTITIQVVHDIVFPWRASGWNSQLVERIPPGETQPRYTRRTHNSGKPDEVKPGVVRQVEPFRVFITQDYMPLHVCTRCMESTQQLG